MTSSSSGPDMAWVLFSAAFAWDPPERKGLTTLTYEPGEEPRNVRRLCADAAIAAGKATEADPPKSAQQATAPPPPPPAPPPPPPEPAPPPKPQASPKP